MQRNLNILAFILALFALALVYSSPAYRQALPTDKQAVSADRQKISQVCLKNNCFQVELARSFFEKNRGLMFRKELATDRGMLFIYDQEGIYSFWMKNTLIPLDMIWINNNWEVVFIYKNAQPCLLAGRAATKACPTINPGVNASYVLEINAGVADQFGLQIGDKVEIK